MTKSAALTLNLTLEKRAVSVFICTFSSDNLVKGFFHVKLKNVVTI